MEMKKIKGGFHPFVTADETLLVTIGSKRIVYLYHLEDGQQQRIRTISHVSQVAVSEDKKRLAVKNTSGTIAVFSLESGEEICRSTMENREGWEIQFIQNGNAVLDFDWDGRIMLLDCASGAHRILDGPSHGEKRQFPKTSYLKYDSYSGQLYKLVSDNYELSTGRMMISHTNKQKLIFETACAFENISYYLDGISFCRKHNYYFDARNCQIVMTDKRFLEVSRIALPEWLEEEMISEIRVSLEEKYLFICIQLELQCDSIDKNQPAFSEAEWLSCLYLLETMEKVVEFGDINATDFLMYDGDRKFVLATWEESYLGML